MKPWSERPFSQVIRLRIRVLWGVIALRLVYMVAVAELGGGDSRGMTVCAVRLPRDFLRRAGVCHCAPGGLQKNAARPAAPAGTATRGAG